jgi:ABC-type antimicrobial peptide transport system permease subunit
VTVPLSAILFEVDAGDPARFSILAALLAAVSAAACAVPALRATRVDPLTSLRSE